MAANTTSMCKTPPVIVFTEDESENERATESTTNASAGSNEDQPTNGLRIKIEKVHEDYDDDDIDIGLDHEFFANPSPLDSDDEVQDDDENEEKEESAQALFNLDDKQQGLHRLLRSFEMPYLFGVLNAEEIYLNDLKIITPEVVLAILQPHLKFKLIIEFQHKLHKWKATATPDDMSSLESFKIKPAGPTTTKVNANGKKFPRLDTILRTTTESAKLIDMFQLGNAHRKVLVDTVVNYFFEQNIPFTQDVRDNLAQQIKEQFMEEDEFYYSDDGLLNGGHDKFYLRLRYLNDIARKPRKKRNIPKQGESPEMPPIKAPKDSSNATSSSINKKPSPVVSTPLAKTQPLNPGKGTPPPPPPSALQIGIVPRQSLPATIRSNVVGQIGARTSRLSTVATTHKVIQRTNNVVQIPHRVAHLQPQPQSQRVIQIPQKTTHSPQKTIQQQQPLKVVHLPQRFGRSSMASPPVKQSSDDTFPRVTEARPIQMRRLTISGAPQRTIQQPPAGMTYRTVMVHGQEKLVMVKPMVKTPAPTTIMRAADGGNMNIHPVVGVAQKRLSIDSSRTPPQPPLKLRIIDPTNPSPPAVKIKQEKEDTSPTTTSPVIVKIPTTTSTAPSQVVEMPEIRVIPRKELEPEEKGGSEVTSEKTNSADEEDEQMMGEQEMGEDDDDEEEEQRPRSKSPRINFVKSNIFQGEFDKSLGSCKELNKNILSSVFEKELLLTNNFRSPEFCEDFVKRMEQQMQKNTRTNIDSAVFRSLPLSTKMAITLFLLPTSLKRKELIVIRGKLMSKFVSLCPTVHDFVTSLPRRTDDPHVAIIGKLLDPAASSFVVFYQKKIYRCIELWHAIDMAVKIYLVYKKKFPVDCATAWQFIMLHFYEMEKQLMFVLPGVHRLRSMLNHANIEKVKEMVQVSRN